jgi:hypothetical protein
MPQTVSTYVPFQNLYTAAKAVLCDATLAQASGPSPETVEALRQALRDCHALIQEREQHASAIETARAQTDDDLEIDDTPLVSVADSGVWVSAWVWVPAPEVEEPEDDATAEVA